MMGKLSKNFKRVAVLIAIFFGMSSLMQVAKAQEISTRAEIYDYDVGDVYHTVNSWSDGGYSGEEIKNTEIIDKVFSEDSNSVKYIKYVDFWKVDWAGVETYGSYVDSSFYLNLDGLINDGDIDEVYSDSSMYNGREINKKDIETDDRYRRWKFADGCGRVDYYSFYFETGASENIELVYYKKGSEEWGEQLIVSINDIKPKQNLIKLYPNPAKTIINIKTSRQLKTCSVFTLQGQCIKTINLEDIGYSVPVSELQTGLYLFGIETIDGIVFKRVIVE